MNSHLDEMVEHGAISPEAAAIYAATADAGLTHGTAPTRFVEAGHEGYYSAYVLDPNGNNIEVVNHHR